MNNLVTLDTETGEIVDKSDGVYLKGDVDAVEIGRAYRKAGGSLVESVKWQIECGRRLAEKKESIGHGGWLPWLKDQADVLGFGGRTAQMLIKQCANTKLASDLTPPEALAISRKTWGHDANHLAQGTGENEWYTPQQYIESARLVLKGIDLDPATSDFAQEIVKASDYFTAADNGLTKDWAGSVWLNPPYSKELIPQFVQKLVDEVASGRVSRAIMLTHSYTDTSWFHNAEQRAARICFTRGRIAFESPSGEKASPTQGQAFFYFGSDASDFESEFGRYGFVR